MIGFDRPDLLWLLAAIPVLWAVVLLGPRKLSLRRKIVVSAARTLVWAVVVLAVAGATWRTEVDDLAVVFVLDRSASLGPAGRDEAVAWVRESLAAQGDHDLAGVVVVGNDALVEAEPREALGFAGVESDPDPNQSDLAAGIRLATALLPGDRTRRIVVLSDGEQTRGDAARQALVAAGEDLDLAVVPVGGDRGPEVLVEDVVAPARVDQGAAYDVRIVARAERETDAKLRLWRNETYLGEVPVHLAGGRATAIPISQEATEPGLYRYRAVLEVATPGADGFPENNTAIATVQVAGRPRILVVEGAPGVGRHLAEAMRGEGLDLDVKGPADLPAGLEELRGWSAVILVNVPAYALTVRQQESLRSLVVDLGRGLAMIGGDHSFGVGGYHDTPIEEALPVKMDLEDKSRFPKLAMVLAIDKSGSMGGGQGSKAALAAEAAVLTAQLLSARDELGVIAFDDAATWVVPLRPLDDKQGTIDLIGSIRPGGGTDIYPALDEAFTGLRRSDAALKHAVLLSDGITADGAFQELITKAHAEKSTLTAIGIGTDADRQTLSDMAKWGGGSWYLVTEPAMIPAIFTREALLASRSFLIEEPFQPAPGRTSEVLRGIPASALPVLGGYVATEAKPLATVGWTIPDPEHPALPLFAHMRAGLGKSAAFTSDVGERWAGEWVDDPSFSQFSAQLGRWLAAGSESGNMSVDAEIRDGELVVTVDAWDGAGGFRNFLDGEARVVSPDLEVESLELVQIAPGRYQATRAVDQDGSWMVGVELADGENRVGQGVAEVVQPYSPEFRARTAGGALLQELGRVGRGGVLAAPADAFRRPEVARLVPRPLWPALLALATLLFLLDVALRRLDFGWDRRARTVELATNAATARVWQQARAKPVAPGERSAAAEVQEIPPPTAPVPEVDPDSYAGKLLAARKKSRKRTGGEP